MIANIPLTQRDKLLGLIQDRYPGYHPLLSIADIAHDNEVDVRTRLTCHQTIVKYVESELKSLEVKATITEDKTIRVSLFDGEYEVVPDAPALTSNEPEEISFIGGGELSEFEMIDQL